MHFFHRKSGSSPRGSVKSDSFDPSETESSTSERTSVEGERRVEEEEEGRREEVEEEERMLPPSKEPGAQFSTATIKPKVGQKWTDQWKVSSSDGNSVAKLQNMLLFVTQQRKDDILLEMKTKPPWQKILLMFMLVFTADRIFCSRWRSLLERAKRWNPPQQGRRLPVRLSKALWLQGSYPHFYQFQLF